MRDRSLSEACAFAASFQKSGAAARASSAVSRWRFPSTSKMPPQRVDAPGKPGDGIADLLEHG
jgi:hypothetical protein